MTTWMWLLVCLAALACGYVLGVFVCGSLLGMTDKADAKPRMKVTHEY